jgi:hypothetical protein
LFASIRFLSSVSSFLSSKVTEMSESFPTLLTSMGFHLHVRSSMCLSETFFTLPKSTGLA